MPQLNFNTLAPSPVASLFEGYTQGKETRNKLMQQEQKQKMDDITLQNAIRDQKIAEEESAAYKAVGGDMNKLPGELLQRGLGKQSFAATKAAQELKTSQLTQAKAKLDLTKHFAGQIFNSPENALTILQQYSKQTGEDISDDLQQIQQLGGTPEAAKKYAKGIAFEADKLLMKFEKVERGNQVDIVGYDPATGETKVVSSFTKGLAPGEAARIQNEGRRLSLEERRVAAIEGRLGLAEDAAKAKRDVKDIKEDSAKTQIRSIVESIDNEFKSLNDLGGIVSKNKGTLSNIVAGLASTSAGQAMGRLAGTPEQTIRDNIASSRLQLLNAIASATGIGTARLNSNVELKTWLDALTSADRSIETNKYILENINNFVDTKRKEKGLPPLNGGGGTAVKPSAAGQIKFLGFEK